MGTGPLFGRTAAAMIASVGFVSMAQHASADTVTRVCVLTGSQEVPPVTTGAIGGGRFVIDTCANTLTYHIVVAGMATAETAAHIHGVAAPGVNAGILHTLPAGPVKAGVWNYDESQEAAILAGNIYVNVHSVANPGGEVRGQVVTHVAMLDGLQENPPNTSPGRGVGLFMIDTEADTLSYHIIYGGLTTSETAAHIHGIANYGTNAGVIHPLPAANPKVGVWSYPAANEQVILNGLTYVNIHTTSNPGGEIRGQIVSSVNPMDGLQENPPNGSAGAGVTLVAIDTAADVLGYDVRYTNLSASETAAHIHGYAPAGTNAGIVHPLALGARKLGTWAYPAGNEAAILDAQTYVNVHTTTNPGGEIRGQIDFAELDPICRADMNCDGALTVADFTAFRTAYLAGDMAADFNGNGTLEVADFTAFRNAYLAGCP